MLKWFIPTKICFNLGRKFLVVSLQNTYAESNLFENQITCLKNNYHFKL